MNNNPITIHQFLISLAVAIAALLTGCGGDQGDVSNPWSTPETLIFLTLILARPRFQLPRQ